MCIKVFIVSKCNSSSSRVCGQYFITPVPFGIITNLTGQSKNKFQKIQNTAFTASFEVHSSLRLSSQSQRNANILPMDIMMKEICGLIFAVRAIRAVSARGTLLEDMPLISRYLKTTLISYCT